ncbi:DEAD/DEAH box helicase family protein [Treponema primitia]|uniref:restriction endonuclease n=1 Tax=Treponema primitia TaxID=88058 RepID=UPI00025557BD|nr:DEAD/DEAH box helicase family protein [Treponema primitia]
MKFNFKIQPFQTEAVDSVVRVFSGQHKQDRISYRRDLGVKEQQLQGALSYETDDEAETGYRNAVIELNDSQLLQNIRKIQTESNIKLSPSLVKELGAVSLDVEMETGTGKTYVYIKTMFELNERYGWSKFIVVVPSIAIREGVNKSFEITQEHFMELYSKKARFFIYNSSNLHQLDEFSQNSGINVMIINIQAFASSLKEGANNKESRIIYSKRDEFGSRKPIDVIKANRPIIILDEPQKMGGAATQNALKSNFNPLFSLNYSATHKTSHNLIYVLDALDAFQKRLVKKIQVKGFDIKNLRGTDKYLYLGEIVVDSKKPPRARLEFEVKHSGGIKRETHLLNAGDSLYVESKNLEQYKGLSLVEIDPLRGIVTFSSGDTLAVGEASGNVNENDIRRIQIRETILSHFEKEEQLFQSGIKCLSLFFIDEVAKYRQYDDDGKEILGEYGKIFEEEYLSCLNDHLGLFPPEYQDYLRGITKSDTHNGYFSIDKQGHCVDSAAKRGSEFSDDISAYDLILKNKERLLSFDEPTRFIFSHSALREGWDNPNVFQICTLKHSDNAAAKRQEVGRGLRLCVNQSGDRQDIDVCGETLVKENPLNNNFYKQEFQDLWRAINLRYAYTVDFDTPELIAKSVAALNAYLYVTELMYTTTTGEQTGGVDIAITGTRTSKLKSAQVSSVSYDLIGKIAEGTTLTRHSVAAILKKLSPDKLYLFRANPEEFIQKVTEEINKQKAAVVVEHISYQPSAEQPYTQDIFNISKSSQEYAKAFSAKHSIQDFVFTDGTAEQSTERKFAESLDTANEVVVYAKLPRGPKGFYIPTPVGNYSPDWAIAFKRNSVKHIFFIAETKGTMDSLNLRPIEQAKIFCARKLFNEISTTGVKYHDVDSYQSLLEVMQML